MLSRWKLMAGILGISIGGLAAASSQCPKWDRTKGRAEDSTNAKAEVKVAPAGAPSTVSPIIPVSEPAPTPLPAALPAVPATTATPPGGLEIPPPVALPAVPATPTSSAQVPAIPAGIVPAAPTENLVPPLPGTPSVPPALPMSSQPVLPAPLSGQPTLPVPPKPGETLPVPVEAEPKKPTSTEVQAQLPLISDAKPATAMPSPVIGASGAVPTPPANNLNTPVASPSTPNAAPAIGLTPPAPQAQPKEELPHLEGPATQPAPQPVPEVQPTTPVRPDTPPAVSKPAPASPFRIILRAGDGEPTFEVKNGDNLVLKVACEKVDIKSPEKGGLSEVVARGKVRFVGFGAEGTCDELKFVAGTGEVSMSGEVKVQVKDKLGRVESELTTASMKYKLDSSSVGGQLKP